VLKKEKQKKKKRSKNTNPIRIEASGDQRGDANNTKRLQTSEAAENFLEEWDV